MKYLLMALVIILVFSSCALKTGTVSFTVTGPAESIVSSAYTSHVVNHGLVILPYSYSYPIYNNVFGHLRITATNGALITVFVDGIYYGESVGIFINY